MSYIRSARGSRRPGVAIKDAELIYAVLSGGGEDFYDEVRALEEKLKRIELLVNRMITSL